MFKIRQHFTNQATEMRLKSPLIDMTTKDPLFPIADYWNGGWCTNLESLTRSYADIYNFEVRDDDVFVVTFPKSGTTWMQETAWLLLNNLDFDAAKNLPNIKRSIYLEMSSLLNNATAASVMEANVAKSPRLLKTHLPLHMLPKQIWQKKTKLIFCARNPKDVAVSFYYLVLGLQLWQGHIDEFVDDFINNDVLYTPYWPRILDFWHLRNESNVFFVTYEQMKRDMRGVIGNLNAFLNKPALKTEDMQKLLAFVNFESMRENNTSNPTKIIKSFFKSSENYEFIRRGIIGAYKDELSVESQQKIEKWSEKFLKAAGVTMAEIFGEI